jgi:MFS transporter, FSR family, fosmidomycin resistance protein
MTPPGNIPAHVTKRNRLLWAVSLGHMTNDLFMGIGPILLAFLGARFLHINAAQIGLAVSLRDLTGAIVQPFFGLRIDRSGGRWLGPGGVVWVVVFLMTSVALALSGQFWLMLLPYALSAVGSGAFHPVGAMYASEANRARVGTNMASFFFFGQMGLSIGPAVVGFLLDHAAPGGIVTRASLTPIFALSLLTVPSVLWMFRAIPAKRQPAVEVHSQIETSPGNSKFDVRALIVLAILVLLRSIGNQGVVSFIPVLFAQKGWDPSAYGLLTTVFLVAAAVSGVAFGWLADRYDRRHVIAVTLCLAAPAFFFLPLAEGALAFLMALLAGGLIGGSFSITVVIAQSLVPPGRKALASGSILGFIFAAGAFSSMLIGLLADGPAATFGAGTGGGIGLPATFQVVAGFTVIASVLALALPAGVSPTRARPSEEIEVGVVSTGSR